MLVPVPAIDPGLIVQVPVAGSPLNATLPVGTVHEAGCVIAPTIGVAGIPGAAMITTSAEEGDVQPVPTDTGRAAANAEYALRISYWKPG